MNRRNFFLSLAVLPAVVKAVVSAPPRTIDTECPKYPMACDWYIYDQHDRMYKEVLRRVYETNPYSQLIQ